MKNNSSTTGIVKCAFFAAAFAAGASTSQGLTYIIDSLTIDPLGGADLQDNFLIVRNGNINTLTGYAATGLNLANSGWWNGNGLSSSNAAATSGTLTKGLGVILNEFGGSPLYTTWHGVPVLQTDYLIGYTWMGNADMSDDGLITGIDTFLVGNNVDNGNTFFGWFNGDFDYNNDGVTGLDTFLQGNAVDNGGGSSAPFAGGGKASSVVPEPGSIGLLLVGALGLLHRRPSRNCSASK